MKKLLGIILIVLMIVILMFLGIGLGLGSASGAGLSSAAEDNSNDRGKNRNMTMETMVEKETEASKIDILKENAEEDKEDYTVYEITVVENNYFYDNSRIEIDAFIDILKNSKNEVCVEIREDKASLKAYNKLIDAMEEQDVYYVEK